MNGALLRRGLAAMAWVAWSTVWAAEPAHDSTAVQLGRAIYEGTLPGFENRVRSAVDASVKLPASQAACVSCHRPSGLGSFEGGVAVPPIAGDLLFKPFDGATTHRYAWKSTLRVRPAYDEAGLRELLRSGHTPDGLAISDLMPRYELTADETAALAVLLRELNAAVAPGVDAQTVRFATITTPEVAPAQVSDLLTTLNRFFEQKNANTRGEFARRDSALRNERSMYRRHRRLELSHWALQGEPDSWAGQLEVFYAREPVFAIVSGLGDQTWQPVHDFCQARRLPCLLPTVALPPQSENFYSVYLSRGLIGQTLAASDALGRMRPRPAELRVLGGASTGQHKQAQAIAQALSTQGWKTLVVEHWQATDVLVSALPTAEILRRRVGPAGDAPLFALTGMRPPQIDATLPALSSSAHWVTEQMHGPAADRQLVRARAWLRAGKLQFSDEVIALNALLAATAVLESLMHADDRFSRDYTLEKLEHNLENMPPLTAYPRLAIGPQQRFASKAVTLMPMMGGVTPHGAAHR